MREAYMRSTRTLLVLLAAALALMLFQAPRAASGGSSPTYTLPNPDAPNLSCGDCPSSTYACANSAPEGRYVKDRESKINALNEEINTLNAEISNLPTTLANLQQAIDQAMAPGSTTDLPTLRKLETQYSQAATKLAYDKRLVKVLVFERDYYMQEKDKTVSDFHNGCGCTYFCASDYWQCPGGPPPPTPAPNNPKNGIGGGQCR
jgi:hypothetical protein